MKRWTTWLLWGALVLAVAMGVARALNARKTQQAAAAEAAQALRATWWAGSAEPGTGHVIAGYVSVFLLVMVAV